MTSKPVATLLDDLQVTRSHSRPRVSNDNPYSEAWNKTLKYAPVFPERFSSLPRRPRLHQRIRRLLQPSLPPARRDRAAHPRRRPLRTRRHHRRAPLPDPGRAARLQHPTRFASHTDPKILDLPTAAWINEPAQQVTAA